MKFYLQPKEYFQHATHHVYNRGVNKSLIFKAAQDYGNFIKRLRFYKNKYKISILAYCLMPNHFHLVTNQLDQIPLSKMMQYLLNGYAMYFNKKYNRSGHLFEGNFKAILVPEDEWTLLHLSRYIHLNPVVASLTNNIYDWPWSSVLDYLNIRQGTLCDKTLILKDMTSRGYKIFLEKDIDRMKDAKKYQKIERLFVD